MKRETERSEAILFVFVTREVGACRGKRTERKELSTGRVLCFCSFPKSSPESVSGSNIQYMAQFQRRQLMSALAADEHWWR